MDRIQKAEQFLSNLKADIGEGGDRAYCRIIHDYVRMPRIETFRDADSRDAGPCALSLVPP
jgi:antirestriction protein ArdC